MAQAQIKTTRTPMPPPARRASPRPRSPAAIAAAATGASCEACHGSGEVWLLDRHAGAVWMHCGCGAARDPGAAASWLTIVGFPCVAAGLCASVFFLL